MKHLPRTQDVINQTQRDRVRIVERKSERESRPQTREISPASQYGAVAVTALADTPEWDVWEGGQVVALLVRLRTAGTSNTVVTFYVNGASIGTVTCASTVTRNVATVDVRLKNGDGIAAVVTTAGTGAKGLSAFVRMKG